MVKNPRIWAAQQIQCQPDLYETLSQKIKLEKVEEEEKKKMKKDRAPPPLKGHHACPEHTPCPLSFIFPLPEERESQHHMFCVYLLARELSSSPGSEHQKMPGLTPEPGRSAACTDGASREITCLHVLPEPSVMALPDPSGLQMSISVLDKIYRHLGNTCLANL